MNFLANCEKIMFVEKESNPITSTETLKSHAKNMVHKCQQMLDNLDEVWEILGTFKLQEEGIGENLKENYKIIDNYCDREKINGSQFFEQYEQEMKTNFEMLNQHLEIRKRLLNKIVEDKEKLDSLSKSSEVIPSSFVQRDYQNESNRLEAFYGVVPTTQLLQMRKVLFRLTRGNIIFNTTNLDNSNYLQKDQEQVEMVNKTLIFILCPGGEDKVMANKISRLLFMSEFKELEIPFLYRKEEMELHLDQEIEDDSTILKTTDQEIKVLLGNFIECERFAGISFYKTCRLLVSRELNFSKKLVFVEKRKVLYSLMFWVPEKYFNYVRGELENIKTDNEESVKPTMIKYEIDDLSQLKTKKAPTYFELNSLTAPFQQIVDTYGIPRYKEINPAIFTVISFPFFFGLMFGDVGHGTIVLILGILLLLTQKDKSAPLYNLKYLIFLNGIFATYCGFIYSEWFANAFAFFPSCYDIKSPTFKIKSEGCVYPFGLDYIWYISENETAFLNSFKMKFSIIIGVIQMLFGTLLKAGNGFYFGKWEDVVFEAIPQFMFMLVTFGYMSITIIIKWLTNWDGRESVSIIQVFINFTNVEEPLFGNGDLQGTLQLIFLIICVICFFMMMCFKPFIVHFRGKKQKEKQIAEYKQDRPGSDSDSNEHILSNFLFLILQIYGVFKIINFLKISFKKK